MKDFVIRELKTDNIRKELENIGFDSTYTEKGSNKFMYKNLKIYGLSVEQANILKQTALSVGADCATNREVITGKAGLTDVVLGGSFSQLEKISEKLKYQPFSLKNLSEDILKTFEKTKSRTRIVGIVNVTPDSFSDGGKYYEPADAINHINHLVEDGADIIDIGAESTKPYSEAVSADEQIKRLKPVLENIRGIKLPLSIDTRSAKVAEFAFDYGISVINDVSGLDFDSEMADFIAESGLGVIIQHSKGTPQNMQNSPVYGDVVDEIYLNLLKKTEFALSKGIKNIILDVGIGFGKTREDNFMLLDRIEEFFSIGYPLMVGVSRKSLLGLNDSDDNELKDALSAAISYPLIQKGVDYLRVHNVKLHKKLLSQGI